jgi:hypothetical protein
MQENTIYRMRYLKKYNEATEAPYYYYIPYGDIRLIKACLKNLNVNEIEDVLKDISKYDDIVGVFIFLHENNYAEFWVHNDNIYNLSIDKITEFCKKNKIEYMGDVTLEDHEISAIKYNL